MNASGRPARRKAAASVAIVVEAPQWRAAMPDFRTALRRAARLALKRGGSAGGALTLLLTDDAALKRLNAQFRGKDKPTDVLSFPATANREDYLGDIAIAYGVTAREAQDAGKSFVDHAAHLVVHGVVHLLGYDHESPAEARIMEALEIAILSELGIADPYAARAMEVA